jgi:hypothetical protein
MTRSIFIAGASNVASPSTKRPPFLSLVVTILSFTPLFAQSPPASPNRPSHSAEEGILAQEGKHFLVAYGSTDHFRSAGEQIL